MYGRSSGSSISASSSTSTSMSTCKGKEYRAHGGKIEVGPVSDVAGPAGSESWVRHAEHIALKTGSLQYSPPGRTEEGGLLAGPTEDPSPCLLERTLASFAAQSWDMDGYAHRFFLQEHLLRIVTRPSFSPNLLAEPTRLSARSNARGLSGFRLRIFTHLVPIGWKIREPPGDIQK